MNLPDGNSGNHPDGSTGKSAAHSAGRVVHFPVMLTDRTRAIELNFTRETTSISAEQMANDVLLIAMEGVRNLVPSAQ